MTVLVSPAERSPLTIATCFYTDLLEDKSLYLQVSVAAFTLPWQDCALATRADCPAGPKILSSKRKPANPS